MKINQLKAGVVLSYLSQGIHILINLFYTPVMLRLLGQSQYGLYQLSSSTISYLGLLSLGFGSSYVRYYSQYKVKNDKDGIARLNGMFITVFAIIGVISAIAGSVLIFNVKNIFHASLTENEIHTAKILMGFMVFNLAISFPRSVFDSFVTANEQYFFQRILGLITTLLNPMLTLPLLFLGYQSISLVVVQTIISITYTIANIIFAKNKLGISFQFKNFKQGLLKELFLFSFWIFLNQIIDQVNWSVDKFILGIFSGTVTVAVYGVASSLNTLCISFSTSISGVFAPRINRMVASEQDDSTLTDLFTRVGRIQFIILGLVVSGLVVFGRFFIRLWAGEGYDDSYYIALLLIIPVVIPLIQNLGIEIQRAKNKHHVRSIIYFIMAIVNVLVSIPLAKYFGGIGAAVGTAASLLLANGLIMNIYYHKFIGINILYFWRKILAFIPALIAPFAFGFVIMRFIKYDSIFVFVGLILAYTLIYCLSMWFLGLNDYEKNLLSGPVKRIFHKRG